MVRKHMTASALLVVLGVLGVCGSAWAHHGSAAYSDELTILEDATVTRFQWANPHSFVMVDVKDDQGQTVRWAAEAGSPSALSLIGWSKGAGARPKCNRDLRSRHGAAGGTCLQA